METALALLEQGRPLYPLDVVRALRDQRAMMVQTTVLILTSGRSYRSYAFWRLTAAL